MISVVSPAAQPLFRPNLSNTLRTDDLINGEFIQRDFLSDSDSSSICHSPSWNDISGRKGRNEKREKKRREKELEKERSNKMINTKTAVKPKKLSKMPPSYKPQFTEYLGSRSEPINNSPGLHCRANINLPTLMVTSPRKNNGDLGKKPLMAFNTASASNLPQTDEHQHSRGFIGGLKLRKVEEAGVQEAIRKIKTKNNKDEDRLSPRQKYRVPEDLRHRIAGSAMQSPDREGFERQSRQQDNSPADQYMISSSSYRGTTNAADYFTIPRNPKSQREQPMNRVHLDNRLRRPIRDFKLAAIVTKSRTTLPGNNQMDGHVVNSDNSHYQTPQAFGYKPYVKEPKNQTSSYNPDSITQTPDSNFEATCEKMPVYQRGPKSITHPISGISALRPVTEKPLKKASEASGDLSQFSDDLIGSIIHYEPSFPLPSPTSDSEITHDVLRRDSASSYSDIILDYADFHNDSASADNSPTSGKATNEWVDTSPSTLVMDTIQQIKRSFDSNESGTRFSQAKSTDFSEENSFKDGYSNITTPTVSRPNSFNDVNSEKLTQAMGQIELESHKEKYSVGKRANKTGSEEQCDDSKTHVNVEIQAKNSYQAETKSNPVKPLRIFKEKDFREISQSSRGQDTSPCTADNNLTSTKNSNEKNDERVPLRGLIKRPKEVSKSQKSNFKSEESSYSQYLQEARSRIGSDMAPAQLPRPIRDISSPRQRSEPVAKMFVICCSCKYFHDMPSKLYACMAKPDDLVTEENLGMSGVMTTSVKCPWCGHCMKTSCCAGYAAVVFMKERLH
ncbi:putative bgh specific protein [Erysiphe neolycopersici]|uniref:Putative bgh specific protein n=1 Tax=Erysiphe neolycopersici TaxID=212602 RepID=A0A420H7T5_9PEZI|nr:putative bgh specific protein [Erysiphe neolycopersici]